MQLALRIKVYFLLLLLSACLPFDSPSKNQIKSTEALVRAIRPEASSIHIIPLQAGLSNASLLLAQAGEDKFVVRFLSGTSEEQKNEIACMQIASSQGYGPKLFTFDEEQGAVVMEYLSPSAELEGNDRLKALAALAQRMHQGPAFPPAMSMFEKLQRLVVKLSATHAEAFPLKQSKRVEKMLQEMAPCLAQNGASAPCHRDLNPSNLLYSHGQYFAIDYEMAAQDDPLFDIATIVQSCRLGSRQEAVFFSSYLGCEPSLEEKSRLYLMKQVVMLSFALRLLAQVPPDALNPPPKLTAKQMLMLARPTPEDLQKPAYKYTLSTLMLKAALQSAETSSYRTAIDVLNRLSGKDGF